MKIKVTAILGLMMLSLSLLALANRAIAAPPTLQTFAWINPSYMGEDPYYDLQVVGYKEGTSWNFTMGWTNLYAVPINVSAIRVYFSWGANYTYRFAPRKVNSGQIAIFNVGNMTPSAVDVSEMWTHSYSVYIHHVNSTTSPYTEVTVSTPSRPSSPIWIHFGSNFAVLSQNHLDCLTLWAKLHGELATVLAPSLSASTGPTYPNEYYVLIHQAVMEFDLGKQMLMIGTFGTAKTHLQNADNLYSQALTAWDQTGTEIELASVNQTKSETSLNYATATAGMVNAYGWLFFGLGWTFIGLGVIIYGLKRPKAASPTS